MNRRDGRPRPDGLRGLYLFRAVAKKGLSPSPDRMPGRRTKGTVPFSKQPEKGTVPLVRRFVYYGGEGI